MKTCSKCRRDLAFEMFCRSSRYICGYHPHCKYCRRELLKIRLAKDPHCARCKTECHTACSVYCYECERFMKGRRYPAKWKKRKTGLDWCPKCLVREKLPYHSYCFHCQLESQKKSREKRLGKPEQPETLRKKSARHYINVLTRRGKVRHARCLLCEEQGTSWHHLDYKNRTRNVIDCCQRCHVLLERAKRKLLTMWPNVS